MGLLRSWCVMDELGRFVAYAVLFPGVASLRVVPGVCRLKRLFNTL